MEMAAIAIAQGAFKLIMAVLAIVAARGTLLWMDKAMSTGFFTAMNEASADAKMLYFSARIVAVCIVVGLAIS
jgi:hypothetical protein